MADEELVRKVAKIARIDLTEQEIKTFANQFEDIIEWFKELGKVDTKGVKPSFHPLKTENVFREDKTEKSLTQEESLIATPVSHMTRGLSASQSRDNVSFTCKF